MVACYIFSFYLGLLFIVNLFSIVLLIDVK